MNQKEIRKRLKEIQKELIIIEEKTNTLRDEKLNLQNSCNHSKTTVREVYFNGSYTDHANTTYFEYCAYCDKLLNKKIEEHSWFG